MAKFSLRKVYIYHKFKFGNSACLDGPVQSVPTLLIDFGNRLSWPERANSKRSAMNYKRISGSIFERFQFPFSEVPAFRQDLLFYSHPRAIKTLLETFPQLRRLTDLEFRDHLAIHQHLLIESTLVDDLVGTGHNVFLFTHPGLELLPFIFSTQPPSSRFQISLGSLTSVSS